MESIFNHSILLDSVVLAEGSGLGRFIVLAIAVFASAYLLRGIRVDGFINVFIVAVVVILVDWLIGGPLDTITAPLSWLTLGLFKLVIDAIVLLISSWLLKGFDIKNFTWALIMAVVISGTSTVMNILF